MLTFSFYIFTLSFYILVVVNAFFLLVAFFIIPLLFSLRYSSILLTFLGIIGSFRFNNVIIVVN